MRLGCGSTSASRVETATVNKPFTVAENVIGGHDQGKLILRLPTLQPSPRNLSSVLIPRESPLTPSIEYY